MSAVRASASAPILVVDDDPELREALRDTLELEGYTVVDRSSGPDALAYLRENPHPSVILLDWNMVPMDAPAFMIEIGKSDLKNIPVILVTADARASKKFTMADFAAYLAKPVKLTTLFELLGRYVAAPSS